MTVYVILYEDLWLNTSKVSQEAYSSLAEAQAFCEERVGPNGTVINEHVYFTATTKQQYTIVEVTVK